MKKSYEWFVNRRNTPKIKLFSIFLTVFYGFAVINCMIVSDLTKDIAATLSRSFLLIGAVLFILIPIALIDKRKENRGLAAVIGAGFVFTFISVLALALCFNYVLLCVIIIETLICVIFALFDIVQNKAKKKNTK